MAQQSQQEKLIREMTEHAFGGRYVFAPPEYRKGRGTREPADLAWYCLDTVVLMYMTETNRGWESDRDHNLSQAKGWLRAWRHPQDQRPLIGENDSQAFKVPFDSNGAVVVLSVTADPEFIGIESHRGWADENDVEECASVSNEVMVSFAKRGGSVTDLVMLLRCWPRWFAQNASLRPIQCFELLRAEALKAAIERVGWGPTESRSSDLDWLGSTVRAARGAPAKGSTKGAAPDLHFDFLADFAFLDQFAFVFTLAKAAELVRAGTDVVRLPLQLARSRAEIIVARNSGFFLHVVRTSLEGQFDFRWLTDLDLGVTMCFGTGVKSPSSAWLALKNEIPELAAK